jgi:hypothetical protein
LQTDRRFGENLAAGRFAGLQAAYTVTLVTVR